MNEVYHLKQIRQQTILQHIIQVIQVPQLPALDKLQETR